jgi:predicted dehydrogenase
VIRRLLIVGHGGIGKRHLRLARDVLPEATIALVARTRTDESAPTDTFERYSSVEEALAMLPDAAVIAIPASMHVDVATRLAGAGVHLLIEKPISTSTAGLAELMATAQSHGVVLMVGYNLRFLPSLRSLRDLLSEGRIGRVLSVRSEVGQWLPAWRPGRDYRETVSARAALGGGVLLELSHEIDYLRWLFGDVEWVRAVQLKQSDLEIDVEDTAHLIIGMVGIGGVPVVATLNMDFIRRDAIRMCTVIGSDGSLRWNGLADTVEVFESGQEGWKVLFTGNREPDESYRAELQHFADCVAGGHAPRVSGGDGFATVKIIEAARRSSLSGSVERVEVLVQAREVDRIT